MQVQAEIGAYITSQPEPKRGDMQALHGMIVAAMPGCKLWVMDGSACQFSLP